MVFVKEIYKRADTHFVMFIVKLFDATDKELIQISIDRGLALTLHEMKLIKKYFSEFERNPTDIELETIAQTWSEHTSHKTFRGKFIAKNKKTIIEDLLKNTVMKATKELNPPWCILVFKDNAGIIEFDEKYALAFKVETHNHPSALEPFGGAATGVGGVIRDILGVWGDPIANTDVLCFGPLNLPEKKVPEGSKHPRYLFNGVVAGVGSYGNNIGIPTVNGSIYFDESYSGNPLVYCGCAGILPKDKFVKNAHIGDYLILAGGRTGRDGLHGVNFASLGLTQISEETSRTSVQIGDPIEEEKLKRAILKIRDDSLASSITDLGGGGLSCAVCETADKFNFGASVELDKVPLKYPINSPWEIWVSESQERMLVTVPEENLERVLKIFRGEEVEAVAIGKLNNSKRLSIYHKGKQVVALQVSFLFNIPRATWVAIPPKTKFKEPKFKEPNDLKNTLSKLLASPTITSKENVIRTYDHEVKGNTVIKPLQGAYFDGPGDAAVIKPVDNSWKGFALSNGFNSNYGKIDCYAMACSVIDEAIRNNICVGGERIALLDNFSWGSPERPELAYGLIEACKACYDLAKEFGTPFISGKDSLYNEANGKPIVSSLLISAIGIVQDIRNAITMDAKRAGNSIYLIGEIHQELGGSEYYKLFNQIGNSVPKVNAKKAKAIFDAVQKAIKLQLISSCHDLSEGGLGVSAAEMAFAGDLGMQINLKKIKTPIKRNDFLLFSESNSRFLVEVAPNKQKDFERVTKGIQISKIGELTQEKDFVVLGLNGKKIIETSTDELKNSWKSGLK